ncbi:MAG: protein TolQ [Alphaproteobacteria bacterium]|nr:MAG: protein TolQ [Alphaproteobacteria bacterium]
METEIIGAAQQVDFSLAALFWRASLIVKLVMIVLGVASVWSWAIIIRKLVNFRRARQEAEAFDARFWSDRPLEELFLEIKDNPRGPSEAIFAAGMTEWLRSHTDEGRLMAGAAARVDRSMNVALSRAVASLNAGLTVLATVGSTAPFIGLFGTVWGIKNAFEEIALQQSTNLAVVAPGIAEALVATALGLLAAIPAVIFYNKLSSDADAITSNYEAFADEFSTIVSRQLDG